VAEITENAIPIGGLLSLDELNQAQVIMPEFTAPTFRPKVTLDYKNIIFNASCVRLFPKTEYVQLLVDNTKRRLIALPCERNDIGVVKWSKVKNGIPQSHYIKAEVACAKVFRMMEWDITYRYKVMAVYQELSGVAFTIFNFADCTMLVPEEITSKDGKKKTKRHTVYPLEWEKLFGPTYGEHRKQYEADIQSYHLLYDEYAEKQQAVSPRVPTAEEIMTREYYVPDALDIRGKKNETK